MSRISLLACLLLLASCDRDAGPMIEITDVRIFAPVPGSNTGVAYLQVANNSDNAILIEGARSPQFERVEMHETTIEDGVSRMRPLTQVEVAAGESVSFEAGGKHFMLMGAGPGATTGSAVTIELSHSDGLLLVSATMRARPPAE